MKYKYDKKNLVDAFKNLAEWAENLDAKSNKDVIDDTWNKLDRLMTEIQMDHDDIFGTEGYEFSILGKD
jgi:DNA-binding transcriptional regulator GbsR (MarR family)